MGLVVKHIHAFVVGNWQHGLSNRRRIGYNKKIKENISQR